MLMDGEDEGLFNHEEADVLMASFMIDAVRDGKKVILILSDDTYVFVILIFWVRKLGIEALKQMELPYTSITSWLLSGIEASSFLDYTPDRL